MFKEKLSIKIKNLLEEKFTYFILLVISISSYFFEYHGVLIFILFIFIFNGLLFKFFFGKNFEFFFKNFFLVDDKKFGYCLKPNSSSKDENSLIFDRFIYNIESKKIRDLNFFKRQNRNNVKIDKHGYRINFNDIDSDFCSKSSKNLKILCSGGSTTFGSFLNNNETWPALLEYELKTNGVDCNVINGGVPGWNSSNEVLRFITDVERIKPDIVILHQGWNDEFVFSELRNKDFCENNFKRGVESALHFHTNKKLNIFKYNPILFNIFKLFFLTKFKKTMNFENLDRWKVLYEKKYFEIWQENLNKFRLICDKNNIKLYIVDYPCLANFFDNKTLRKYIIKNSRLSEDYAEYQAISKLLISIFLKHQNFAKLISLDNKFENLNPEARLKFFFDEIHMTEKGNSYLAKIVSKTLINQFEKNFDNFYKNTRDREKINLNSIIKKKFNFIDNAINKKMIEKFLDKKSFNPKDISTFNYTLD
jgi:lysophospholipase L1-like esterase